MPDTRWDETFREAAESDTTATAFAVADDVARGRRRLRARRAAAVAVVTLTGSLVLGFALVDGSTSPDRRGVAPVDSGVPLPDPVEVPSQPVTPPVPSDGASDPGRPVDDRSEAMMPGEISLEETADWRRALFLTARSVLDPDGRHLDYSTHSLTSGGDGRGGVHLGIKMGWRVPGHPGEGLVQVRVSNERGFGSSCASVVGERCRETRSLDGAEYDLLRTDGGFVIRHRQDDGEVVLVQVDRLFGNNATVPVGQVVTEREALRLARDERLDLP